VYGYSNEVLPLSFWGKKVIVVGAGAFAFENLRTAVEHGARHVSILGRRAGTTCPKWIDIIALIRPLDPNTWGTNKSANAVSFECWKDCYHNSGLPTPECWDEGLLKPHNHTVSVSDLVFIGGFHGLTSLLVGQIKKCKSDGTGVELTDGRILDADIIIKATGFHLQDQVPVITGKSKIHSFNLLDYNLHYGAEPLLDGGQFGSSKGKLAADPTLGVNMEHFAKGLDLSAKLGLPDSTMRANPFGSAYAPGANIDALYFKWFCQNQDHQKRFLRLIGEPVQDGVTMWASEIGSAQYRTFLKVYENFGRSH
jgi:hypothetical protein